MAYIGQPPFQEFIDAPTKDNFTGDGSTTTFDLANSVPSNAENALAVFVNNVRQEPGSGKAFTLGPDGSNDMKRITFSSAPANSAAIYVINNKTNSTVTAPLQNDLNGSELILDGDGDTSIHADNDDRIDFKIAAADHFHITTSSGDTVIQNMTDAKDFKFNQYDGRTILEINDAGYVALANGATGSGELRIYEDTDNGTNYTGFKVGAQSANIDYVLPTADGTSGNQLATDGSGNLSWAAPGTTITNDANNRITTATGSATLNGEANLTFDGSTLAVTGAVTVSTNLDVDGTANLDAVDIDGAVQLDATLTVGANDQGYDVILYGDTASANLTWDTSADDLIFNGAAGLIVPDGQLTLGSTAVTSTAAEINLLDTAVANTVVNSKAVIYGSSGELAGTLSTAAQGNVTSLGTLTALTVDDVAVNGKVITMTGSSGDTATVTVGTNGTLDITTTDTAAAAANIQITADGTAELAGTTVTLDSSGGITLDADGGTITFADGGSSLGTITSSGYSGTAAVATTVTITDNESTNENNAIIFTAGGDVDGGNLGLESDGDLTYNPSSGTLNVPNISVTGTQTIVNSVTMNANNAVIFEGATADAHETTLSTVDATGDRTINLPNVSGTLPVLAAASATQITSTPEEINLIDGGATVGTTAVADGDGILHNDAGTMKVTSAATFKTYFQEGISMAYDDFTAGDAAVNITTTAGDITIDAQGNDTDIIFKGTDGSSDTTFLTIDGSAAGAATFNDKIIATELDISGNVDIDGTTNLDAVDVDGNMQIDGHVTVGANDQGYDVIFYGDTASANIMWDTSADDWIASGDARIVVPDGNLVLGSTAVTSTAAELNKLDGATVSRDELNLIDGGTARGTTALASGDGILINDGGTMRMTNVDTVKTFMQVGAGLPSGTVMVFFQASAPTGWTKSTDNNDKTLRVVSGNGGGTGGDWAMSAGETTSSHGGHAHSGAAHSHNHNLSAGAHTLSTSEMPSHSHNNRYGHSVSWNNSVLEGISSYQNIGGRGTESTGGGSSHSHNMSGSISSGGDGDTGSAGSHTHTIAAPQYIDVIVCAKD